jgi:beta-mannanase
VWSVTGASSYKTTYYVQGLYPGDDVVDWIGWDPYNWYRCHNSSWISFADKIHHFYDWLMANGHANKPFMLSEYGSRESDVDPLAKGQWFKDELAAMKAGTFPNLKALLYFDSHPTECDWRVDTSPASLDGFRQLANDPYLNP